MGQNMDDVEISLAEEREFLRDTIWTVAGKRDLGPIFKKWKFDFVLDARRTFISDTPARILGVRLGMEYRRVNRFGFGIYDSGSGVYVHSLSDFDQAMEQARVTLSYVSAFYERVLYFHPKWEWSMTYHFGKGRVEGDYVPEGTEYWLPLDDRNVYLMELSSTGYYNLFWWCNIGMGAGYRQVSGLQQEFRKFYSAPVAIARVRIRLGKLVQSIWDRDIMYEY